MAALKQSPAPTWWSWAAASCPVAGPRALVDEYVLMIHPLILGQGRRLFPEGAPADLRLAESVTTTTGVIIARYQTR